MRCNCLADCVACCVRQREVEREKERRKREGDGERGGKASGTACCVAVCLLWHSRGTCCARLPNAIKCVSLLQPAPATVAAVVAAARQQLCRIIVPNEFVIMCVCVCVTVTLVCACVCLAMNFKVSPNRSRFGPPLSE